MSQLEVEVGKVRCDTILTIVQYLQNKARDTQPEVKLDWYVMKMRSTYVLTVDSEFSQSNCMANKIITEIKQRCRERILVLTRKAELLHVRSTVRYGTI
jgi:hypothetical protein